MAYYKNKIKKDVTNFKFTAESYKISEDIQTQYKKLKQLFHLAINNLTNHKEKLSTKKLISKLLSILDFYDAATIFVTVLIEEVFKNPINKKKELFVLLNKMFKLFFVFDITRFQNPFIFHHFAFLKDKLKEKNLTNLKRITVLSAISMPMAHLFMSYFRLDYDEIHVPTELIKRNVLFLSDAKKEHLYFLACVTCKFEEFPYCRIFFCGLFNRFFQSGFFIQFIDCLNEQQQSYYVALAEFLN
ncbi:hypothetical protein GVAV_002870 [Gurleya vavrai]